MSKAIITILFLLYAQCYCNNRTYTTKYDNVNLDEILSSERLVDNFVKCLMDEGPCTPEGNELKQNLPDAIGNNCEKCTERQKEGADRVMQYLIDNRPEDWERLEEKFNSDGSYRLEYIANKHSTNSTPSH